MNQHKGWIIMWDMLTGTWGARKGDTKVAGYSDVVLLKYYLDEVESHKQKEKTR